MSAEVFGSESEKTETTKSIRRKRDRKPGMFGEINNTVTNTLKSTSSTINSTLTMVEAGVAGVATNIKQYRVESAEEYAIERVEAKARLSTAGYTDEEIVQLFGEL